MPFIIKKAERRQARLRLGLCGPSGSGKSYSALRVAKGLTEGRGERIAAIDTERDSLSLYADHPELQVEFDVIAMTPPYSPERYQEALHVLEEQGYSVIIIDQISHAWAGEGGLLEYVDTLKRGQANQFSAWAKATPQQNRFVDAMLRSPAHLIATMRVKTEWVIEEHIQNGQKRNVPRKIGMAPIQRDGIEHEFTTVLDLDITNQAVASKDRTGLFTGHQMKLDEEWGKRLRAWLESGAEPLPEPQQEPEKPTRAQQTPPNGHSKWQVECGALLTSLKAGGDQRFSNKTKILAHIMDWAHAREFDVVDGQPITIEGLGSLTEEQREKYASTLADLLNQQNEAKAAAK